MTESLRNRKKRVTMQRIQEAAYHLAAVAGFEATTVEEIAAEADVSPATVYRSFGTKEAIFLWDPFEEPMIDAIAEFLEQGADPYAAIIDAVQVILADTGREEERSLHEMLRFAFSEPALRDAYKARLQPLEAVLAGLLGSHGLDELESAVLACAAVGALWAALDVWQRDDHPAPFAEVAHRSLQALTSMTARPAR